LTAAPALLWFRQDLRLSDHAALHAALRDGRKVLPVFVLDDAAAGAWAPGGAARWWLHHSLSALSASLAALGAKLVLRRGSALEQIPLLAKQIGAADVHTGGGPEPWARALDREMAVVLQAEGVGLHRHRTRMLFNPEAIRTGVGGAYGVYTPFARACRMAGPPVPLPAPDRIPSPSAPRSDRLEDWGLLPERPDWAGGLRATWTPGEVGAQAQLQRFLAQGLAGYAERRNLPALAGTSMLSPHLSWGEISMAQAWLAAEAAAEGAGAGLAAFQSELLWREFSIYQLWHFPALPEQPLKKNCAAMPWRHDPAGLAAWQRGQTGIPIVDAGMRQLWQTGWMHNRVRMITASFLTKHLLLPWRTGEEWFWDTLVDADLSANAASWQWVAGSGADAAPFFRVFNPVLQGRKFDPDGAYVRRFVPELAGLGDRYLHAPWEAPSAVLAADGITLGSTYPQPILDLAAGRDRALAAWRGMAA
jgi:deoxyribodipyrimidine photo-lyase